MNIGYEVVSLQQSIQVLSGKSQSSISMRPIEIGGQVYEIPGATDVDIDQASFNLLLSWLDPDSETAGQKYEIIRRKLIRLFNNRRCIFAEDLADETFNRVARGLSKVKDFYVGNPLNYFFGVARRVYLEYLRRLTAQKQLFLPVAVDEDEELFKQLDDYIGQLPHKDRDLILTYYQGNGRDKIDQRKKLAEEMGIQLNTLRLRAYRIVCRLRKQANSSGACL